jgi:hypothetical protein
VEECGEDEYYDEDDDTCKKITNKTEYLGIILMIIGLVGFVFFFIIFISEIGGLILFWSLLIGSPLLIIISTIILFRGDQRKSGWLWGASNVSGSSSQSGRSYQRDFRSFEGSRSSRNLRSFGND